MESAGKRKVIETHEEKPLKVGNFLNDAKISDTAIISKDLNGLSSVFAPEKITTLEFIEKGNSKEFVYTRYEEIEDNTYERLYLKRSWIPKDNNNELKKSGVGTKSDCQVPEKEESSDISTNITKRLGAIESLKKVFELEKKDRKNSDSDNRQLPIPQNSIPLLSPGLTTKIPFLNSRLSNEQKNLKKSTDLNNNNRKPFRLSSNDEFLDGDLAASEIKRHHVYLTPKRKIPIVNSAIIIKDSPPKKEESSESETEERVIVVRHSSSEDSINKVDQILSQFIMDKKPSEKKRSNSFKKLFKGSFFGWDKKKDEEKRKGNDQIDASIENSKNSFVRHSVHRNTVDGSCKTENYVNGYDNVGLKSHLDDNYTYKGNYRHSNHKRHNGRSKSYIGVNNPRDNFKGDTILGDYHRTKTPTTFNEKETKSGTYINVPNINKYIDASSSSTDSRNNTYENSLIAQAEMRQSQDYDRRQKNTRSAIPVLSNNKMDQTNLAQKDSPRNFAETPPRAQETYQNVQLVKPKALIPINSERPLPNPYRSKKPNLKHDESAFEMPQEEQEVWQKDEQKIIPSEVTVLDQERSEKIVVKDIYEEPRDVLKVKEDNCKKPTKPIVPLRTKSLEKANNVVENSLVENSKSSPIIKPKPINVPLEIKTSSPTLSKFSDSTNSPRSRDSYGGIRNSPIPKSPKSPVSPLTLEKTKLKLPPNREKIELQPRVRSPIPKEKVSTDKIIATELLKSPNQKQSEFQKSLEGERSQLVITRTNTKPNASKLASPSKISKPSAQRNILQELQIDPSEVQLRHDDAYRYRQLNNLKMTRQNNQHLSPNRLNGTNQENMSASSPNYQSIPPNEPIYQYSQQQINNYSHLNGDYTRQNMNKISESLIPKVITREMDEITYRNLESNNNVSLLSLQNSNLSIDPQRASLSNFSMSSCNISPRTRNSLPAENPHQRSPQKQQILQNVEAFYWRELKKLKEKEEQDLLNYKKLYGYVEDPVVFHRSRSTTPNTINNSRRSLSLPREIKSTNLTCPPNANINYETVTRPNQMQTRIQYVPVQNYSHQNYTQAVVEMQPRSQNPNFVRRSTGRNTIGPIGSPANIQTIYENYPAGIAPHLLKKRQIQNPIFRRGSLMNNSPSVVNYQYPNQYKKVSFGSQNGLASPVWPTRNGFTQSPPQRRIERLESIDDDVFLPNSPRVIKRSERATSEPVYTFRLTNESPNGMTSTPIPRQKTVAVNVESPYGHSTPKKITVSNKVCDIYGQIHEKDDRVVISPDKFGPITQTGVIYGTLESTAGSRLSLASRQSNVTNDYDYGGNFVRGTRLTASFGDMYRRYPNQRLSTNNQQYINETMNNENTSNIYAEAPTRPLPPLPPSRRSRSDLLRKAVLRGNPPASDCDSSSSEAGEIQRILQSDHRNNRAYSNGK